MSTSRSRSPRAQLSVYRAKRDFTKTQEPSGKKTVAASPHLRFVVQKHAATRLHYDLRLELDGIFKSWAVTRGPSLDPRDKRLAVEVEDHPLDYGDFEGTIPHGEYGGGTVQLWDRGYWAPDGNSSPQAALAAGELKFVLAGERLNGGWVLVRMKHDRTGGKRTNWLLIKHRDDHAGDQSTVEALHADDRSVASGRPMAKIAAGTGPAPQPFMLKGHRTTADAVWQSDRSAGSPRSANIRAKQDGARPRKRAGKRATRAGATATLPDFIEPQLCESVLQPPNGKGWVHELKLDGYRVQARVRAGIATLRTRKGLDWTTRFGKPIAEAVGRLPDGIYDGEIVALDARGNPSFGALQTALSAADGSKLVYFVFDLLHDGNDDFRKHPLSVRKEQLRKRLVASGIDPQVRYAEHFDTAGDSVLRSACQLELEGVVSKRIDAPYHSGRSDHWRKSKCRGGQEVVVGGWTTTDGRFRSLLAGMYRNGSLRFVGRIGTGFGASAVRALLPMLRKHAAKVSPFEGDDAPRKEDGFTWLHPLLVAEIEFAGWTQDGRIRQASFKGLREDKAAREVRMETPVDPKRIDRAQPSPKSKTRGRYAQSASVRRVVMGVTLSHPEKVLWPHDEGPTITKLELAEYYEAVADWMMEHLRGRPCSIIRAPDGIDGERFFQRHAMRGASNLLDEVRVHDDAKAYLQIDRREGLAALAQIAAVELHPWNGQPDDPQVPGRLVFDLDPAPDVPFTAVVDAAKAVRERLADLGLTGFCKSTGGKGLHVVTPLAVSKRARLDWKIAKAFAREVCTRMAVEDPQAYTVNMSKKVRTGRIYLDYLRNDLMSTAVAPLSPRARPGAPVSMPLTWAQVTTKLDPARYTLRTVPKLIARSRAWADYGNEAHSLVDAIRKLGRARVSR